MAGMELSGREVKIDLAAERGAHTPRTGYMLSIFLPDYFCKKSTILKL